MSQSEEGLPSELVATMALMDSALLLLVKKKNTAQPAFGCPSCGANRGTVAGLQYHLKNRVCLRASLRNVAESILKEPVDLRLAKSEDGSAQVAPSSTSTSTKKKRDIGPKR